MSVADGASRALDTPHACPEKIELTPDFIHKLFKLIQQPETLHPGFAGLLFGTAAQESLRLQAFEPFEQPTGTAGQDKPGSLENAFVKALATAHTDPDARDLNLLGWCVIRMEHEGLTEADIEFHNRYFKASNLALVLRIVSRTELGFEFYSNDTGSPLSRENYRRAVLLLPAQKNVTTAVHVTMRAKVSDDRYLAMYQVAQSLENSEQSVQLAKSVGLKPRSSWLALARVANESALFKRIGFFVAVLCIAVIGFSLGIVLFRYWSFDSGRTLSQEQVRGTGSGQEDLQLRVDHQGHGLTLSWNQQSAILRGATDAVLEIRDGVQRDHFPLSAEQLSAASIFYHPISRDVTFLLQIRTSDGQLHSQIVRALDGSGAPISSDPGRANLFADQTARNNPIQDLRTAKSAPAPPVSADSTAAPLRSGFVPLPSASRVAPSQDATRLLSERMTASAASARPPLALSLSAAVRPEQHAPQQQPARTGISLPGPAPQNAKASSNSAAPPDGLAASSATARPPITLSLSAPLRNDQRTASTAQPGQVGISLPSPAPQNANTPPQFTTPRPIKRVLPDLRPVTLARIARPNSPFQVEVKVIVDKTGKVTRADLLPGDRKVNASITAAAVMAAKQWTFEPGTLRGQPVESTHTIVFDFK